jgi:hypothetical protein
MQKAGKLCTLAFLEGDVKPVNVNSTDKDNQKLRVNMQCFRLVQEMRHLTFTFALGCFSGLRGARGGSREHIIITLYANWLTVHRAFQVQARLYGTNDTLAVVQGDTGSKYRRAVVVTRVPLFQVAHGGQAARGGYRIHYW